MSKFIDKLKETSQAVVQPMGFGRRRPASPRPRILLVASLGEANVSKLAELVAGADAALLDISDLENDTKTLQGCAAAVPDIPWGGWLRGSQWRKSQTFKALGPDFVVFPAESTPLEVLEDTAAGKIVEVKATLSEGLLRTIDELPVDGVLAFLEGRDSPFLTWQELMLFERLGGLVAKPLLVPVPLKVTAGELKMLWEAGVDGVILTLGPGQPRGGLRQLRQAVDRLAFPLKKRRERVKALLPQVGGAAGTEEEDIGEEEEELPSDL
jgi:hypothetical protein